MNFDTRIALFHTSFKVFGGAEEYFMYLLKVLISFGFYIDVYTLDNRNFNKLCRISGSNVRFFTIKPFANVYKFFGYESIYDFIFYSYSFSRFFNVVKKKYSLTINGKANEVPIEADICVVHYPLGYMLYHWDRVPLGAGVDPKYTSSNFFWKLYIQPFRIWFYRLSRRLKYCRVVVVNSRWVAGLLRELGGIDSVVVYPPIKNLGVCVKGVEKKNVIVTVSRFDPSKRLEGVLYVAGRIPEARFVLIGRVEDITSYRYYSYLRGLIEKFDLRNVYLLPNLGEEAKNAILSKAKIYFHPTIGEHFGIAVLEGLVRGAIPVVHRYSGSCTDIVRGGEYGYCYSTYKEAVKIIRYILHHDVQPSGIRNLENLLSEFSYDTFRRKFSRIINTLLEEKSCQRDS